MAGRKWSKAQRAAAAERMKAFHAAKRAKAESKSKRGKRGRKPIIRKQPTPVDFEVCAAEAVARGQQVELVRALVHALVDSGSSVDFITMQDLSLLNWTLRKMRSNRQAMEAEGTVDVEFSVD